MFGFGRDDDDRKSVYGTTWVYEETPYEQDYHLAHTHCPSTAIEFCGAHLPGIDTIYVQSFDKEAFANEDIMIGDEVIGLDGEPLHPGLDALGLKTMVDTMVHAHALISKHPRAGVDALEVSDEHGDHEKDPPMIHFRRRDGGIEGRTHDTHHNHNMIFHYGKEYPIAEGTKNRPFLFAADKTLLQKAKIHCQQMINYHELDNKQLSQKIKMLIPESGGDVKKGKAMAKATLAMRLAQEHRFYKEYVKLFTERKRLNEEILKINKAPLHGLVKEKIKADLIDTLLVCEQSIISHISERVQQIKNYSDYDFRHELITLKAEKIKLETELEAMKVEAEGSQLQEKKAKAVEDIEQLKNLEMYAKHDKADMMEHIHKKELELDGIFETEDYNYNEDEMFPHSSEYWRTVNRPGGL